MSSQCRHYTLGGFTRDTAKEQEDHHLDKVDREEDGDTEEIEVGKQDCNGGQEGSGEEGCGR